NIPKLLGYVKTEIKPNAKLLFTVEDQDSNFPLLASWNYKQGTVINYTSDANGRWSRNWTRWNNYQPFWKKIIETIKIDAIEENPDVPFNFSYALEGSDL